jgi:hypothetical protein
MRLRLQKMRELSPAGSAVESFLRFQQSISEMSSDRTGNRFPTIATLRHVVRETGYYQAGRELS